MARKGRIDRGLLQKHDAEGKKFGMSGFIMRARNGALAVSQPRRRRGISTTRLNSTKRPAAFFLNGIRTAAMN